MVTRLAITGPPKSGKTTAANKIDPNAAHTDDVRSLGWSESSEAVVPWFGVHEVIEGVAVPRALRKWLLRHPDGKPCEELLVLTTPRQELSGGQQAMAKGIATVLREILPELQRRGVNVKFEGD